ncbi:MAG: hypothetical protein HOP35_00990 [Nitrospira sp.]|nr:hypothetical protein [Nitrospira sp.]
MTSPLQPPFSYLRRKIREWKSGDLLRPGNQSWEQFRQLVLLRLAPIVTELQIALEAEGLRTTVRGMSEETRHLSLTVEDFDIEITFDSDENPHAFQVFTYRRANREGDCAQLIAYRDLELNLGRVIEIIEGVALHALGPRRASKEPGDQ